MFADELLDLEAPTRILESGLRAELFDLEEGEEFLAEVACLEVDALVEGEDVHDRLDELEDGVRAFEVEVGAGEDGEGVVGCQGWVGEFGTVAGDEGEDLAFQGFGDGFGEKVFAC